MKAILLAVRPEWLAKILDMDYFNVIADNCNLTYQEYELLRKVLGNENTNNKNK